MKRILVIEREYGCGGGAIAELLAGRLGWTLWDRSLTQEIARRARVDSSAVRRCDERTDTLLHRVAKVFWRGSYELAMEFNQSKVFDTDRMVSLVQQIIEEASEKGKCVIVGRGAPYILRERTDTLRVFLYAPWREKVRRLVAAGTGEEEAMRLLDTVDKERADFVKSYFGMEWPTRSLYHLMINTAAGDPAVMETILFAMKILDR
jgi:cytidylate kinase